MIPSPKTKILEAINHTALTPGLQSGAGGAEYRLAISPANYASLKEVLMITRFRSETSGSTGLSQSDKTLRTVFEFFEPCGSAPNRGSEIGKGWVGLLVVALLCLPACRKKPQAKSPPAPLVEVATVTQGDVPIYHEWVGVTDGLVNAQIRAQV